MLSASDVCLHADEQRCMSVYVCVCRCGRVHVHVHVHVCVCMYTHIHVYVHMCGSADCVWRLGYEVATISRLLKITGLFCKRALLKRRHSAKETCNFKEPTNRSHPIEDVGYSCMKVVHRKQLQNK